MMGLWRSLIIAIVVLFFSKSILSIDGDNGNNSSIFTTKRRRLYSSSSISKRHDYHTADKNGVSLSNICFMDVQKLSHEFQDGFYSCEVEWNIKVSFDLSFQLGEYCHDVLGGDDDDGGGGGVDSDDTTMSGEEDNHHGDYNDGGSDWPVNPFDLNFLAVLVLFISSIIWVHHDVLIAKFCFRSNGTNSEWSVLEVIKRTVLLFILNLVIRHSSLHRRVPVHASRATVDESIVIHSNKGFHYRTVTLFVHRKGVA